MSERWKPVVGYEGIYEVSDHGRVRSLDRTDRSGRSRKGGLRKQKTHRDGYREVTLRNGSIRTFSVHRLVLEAFTGPCPDGMECCHFPDNDRTNNHVNNLRWDTRKANCADQVIHGTVVCRSKLSEHDIASICHMSRAGEKAERLAEIFNVSPATIYRAKGGYTWKHVSRPQ